MHQFLCGLLLCFGIGLSLPTIASESEKTKSEISQLLEKLKSSNCQFNRNGTWYNANDAVAHLEKKRKYLNDKNMIQTAEDFIEKAAAKSSASGKEYVVKCDPAQSVSSSAWLIVELKRIRNQ